MKKYKDKTELLQDPLIQDLISESLEWFPFLPKRHDDSKMSHYKLRMLADFGLTVDDHPDIRNTVEKAKSHIDNRLPAIRQKLPEKDAPADCSEWNALPCDAAHLTTTLYRLGDRSDIVLQAIDILKDRWTNEPGWFCNLFFVKSQFKKYQAPCPMAGLHMLELAYTVGDSEKEEYIQNAFKGLSFHRDLNMSLYYFGRSKKFWTFKYPFVWYNALYLAHVISNFPEFRKTELYAELVNWIKDNKEEDESGQPSGWKPTSIFMPYKKWDFGNKKQISPWITHICNTILEKTGK